MGKALILVGVRVCKARVTRGTVTNHAHKLILHVATVFCSVARAQRFHS